MLRKLGRLEMLHRGTHQASGWLAGSRRASRCVWMMMMLFPLPLGPYFPGKLAGFCCRRVVFLAVISWRGGGRVKDPVEAAFQGRSGHITPL